MEYNNRLDSIVERTLKLVRESRPVFGATFSELSTAKAFCELKLAGKQREEFLVLYLNSQHQLIEDKIEFVGTINSAAVYPREIAKRCLELNAASVILCHNHPSGLVEPSQADIRLTSEIKRALALFDISTLDHIIVGDNSLSFAARGLL